MAFWKVARPVSVLLAVALLASAPAADVALAQAKKLKIGVIYDLTGPFAGGGSELHYARRQDHDRLVHQEGPDQGYKIEAVYADGQSKPDVVINEATRLIEQEKVDMLLGFYSSAECVPAAARIEQFKKFMWITTCIASPVLRDRHLKYVFRAAALRQAVRPRVDRDGGRLLEGASSARSRRTCASPSSTRTAPTALTSPRATRKAPRRSGLNVVLERGLFGLRARSVIAGHQAEARAAGRDLPHRLQSGHQPVPAPGARTRPALQRADRAWRRYSDYDGLKQAVGTDANYFFNVDPISIWETNPKSLKPELPPMIQMVGDEYDEGKARHDDQVAACRHGGVQYLPVLHRRAAARHQEVRRHQRRCAAQGGARNGRAGRRHHAGLRRQVRGRGRRDGRAERPAPSRWSSSTSTTRPTWCGRSRSSSASRC